MKNTHLNSNIGLFATFFVLILSFSACNKSNREAVMALDTHSLVFAKGQTERYFSIVNTGDKVLNYTLSSQADFISLSPTSGQLGFNQTARIKVLCDASSLDFGNHTAIIQVQSNADLQSVVVSVHKEAPLPAKLAWDVDYIKIAKAQDSAYVELSNTGESDLTYQLSSPQAFLSFTFDSGSIAPQAKKKVWVKVDRAAMADGLQAAELNVSSTGGNADIQLDVEKNVYSITFFNPCYTPITIKQKGFAETHEIAVAARYSFVMASNPSNFGYEASTQGKAADNTVLGLNIKWDETLDVSQEPSPIYDLNMNKNFFFMKVRNKGTYKLDKWSINNGTQQQIDDNITIPNDGNIYNFGYYDALSNTKVYAHLVGTTNSDAYWANGQHFTFPNTINQMVLLESSLKTTAKRVKSALKPVKTAKQALISPQGKQILRHRSTQGLENK